MSKQDISLNPRIIASAKEEFLERGYEKASTNAICKNAGVTWGALSKRYSGKDELFCTLVSDAAEEFRQGLRIVQNHFDSISPKRNGLENFYTDGDTRSFIDKVYSRFDEFKLLVDCAGGSSYENYWNELVDILMGLTSAYLIENDHVKKIDSDSLEEDRIRILVSFYLYSCFEPVKRNMPKNQAIRYCEQVKAFFVSGLQNSMNLSIVK